MAITFPLQINGQTADAGYINSIAGAVASHDATLEEISHSLYGTGKYLTTAGTKATSASTSDVAVTDYQMTGLDIPAGRMTEFVARLRVASTVANDVALIRLKMTSAAGVIAAEEPIVLPVSGTPLARTLRFPWRSVGGPNTWLLTVQRLSGTGSVTVTVGGPTIPGIFYARDLGSDTRFTIV